MDANGREANRDGGPRIAGSTVAASILALGCGLLISCSVQQPKALPTSPEVVAPPEEKMDLDKAFLEDLEHRAFNFFWNEANPTNGLVPDRARADGSGGGHAASMAAVGFGLTALCVGDERGWVSHNEVYARVLTTLRTLWNGVENEHGFFYHFVNMQSGLRDGTCELSSIDTALLMAGVLTCRQYYDGTEVAALAKQLYDRVDWPWMLAGQQTLSMGWTPEHGFLPARWHSYNELMLLYLLGLGSTTHPLPPESWHAWRRDSVMTYGGRTFLQCPPLFTHQFSHAWFDFRNLRDAYADYGRNTALATLVQRQFCTDLQRDFPGYGPEMWGLSAADGPHGYMIWGGPPPTPEARIDGSVVPYAVAGSLPFAPKECLATLRHMREQFGEQAWSLYGFRDAFNPQTGWGARDVLGIDLGITLLMVENYRTGLVWKQFMRNPEMRWARERAGFHDVAPSLSAEERDYLTDLAHDTWNAIRDLVHPGTGLPFEDSTRGDDVSLSTVGLYLTDLAAASQLDFVPDAEASVAAGKVLESLSRMQTWRGFRQNWNGVASLEPSPSDRWASAVENAQLAAGLVVVEQRFPQHAARCRALLDAMEWGAYYDPARDLLVGGHNLATDSANPNWTLSYLGDGARLAVFFAVATGAAPPSCWKRLARAVKEAQQATYLDPGPVGDDLVPQFTPGLWLDERETLMGQSAENRAFAQMERARTRGLPAWGWSECRAPDGALLAANQLRDAVVAPYASALAVASFPSEVADNLRRLEELGARDKRRGFYDAINIETGAVSDFFRTSHQSMLLLSLANTLTTNPVQTAFLSSPLVAEGRRLVDDYRWPAYHANNALKMLDVVPHDLRVVTPERRVAVRNFSEWAQVEWHVMDRDFVEMGNPNLLGAETHAEFAFAWTEEALLLRLRVADRTPLVQADPGRLFEGDHVELFVDPQAGGLAWGAKENFQFGFAAPDRAVEAFGQRRGAAVHFEAAADGYVMEASVPWKLLSLTPAPGLAFRASPAVQNLFSPGQFLKMNWCWALGVDGVELAELVLE